MENQAPQMKVDIKSTTKVESKDGNLVFAEGVLLRKVSKFLSGTGEEGIIPIPCFYDVKTGEILTELLPKDIRDEYEKGNIEKA